MYTFKVISQFCDVARSQNPSTRKSRAHLSHIVIHLTSVMVLTPAMRLGY